jgi:hypothetical protein
MTMVMKKMSLLYLQWNWRAPTVPYEIRNRQHVIFSKIENDIYRVNYTEENKQLTLTYEYMEKSVVS